MTAESPDVNEVPPAVPSSSGRVPIDGDTAPDVAGTPAADRLLGSMDLPGMDADDEAE